MEEGRALDGDGVEPAGFEQAAIAIESGEAAGFRQSELRAKTRHPVLKIIRRSRDGEQAGRFREIGNHRTPPAAADKTQPDRRSCLSLRAGNRSQGGAAGGSDELAAGGRAHAAKTVAAAMLFQRDYEGGFNASSEGA